MKAWVLAGLVSTAAWASEGPSIRLTAGWVRALDVKGLQRVRSADPAVLSVTMIEPDQVLLSGVDDGETTLSVWAGSPVERTDHLVVVIRGHTLLPFDGLMKVEIDDRRMLSGRGLTRVAVGDATICEATLTGSETLALVPRRPGTTSLIVWADGTTAAHRRQILLTVESGGIKRTSAELDGTLTEPRSGRLVLVAGEHAVLDLPATTRLAIVDSNVAVARAGLPGEVVVEGRASGATFLQLWAGTHRQVSLFVVVHPRSQAEPEPDDPEESPTLPVPVGSDL
jgi:hypothetical protein